MPAIRPERLQQRAEEIAAAIENPAELERRLLDLLDFHADRTRRSPEATSAMDAVGGFGVPHPVLVAIERALAAALADYPERREDLGQALWEMGFREAQLLAASVLAGLNWERAHELVERFIRASRDRRVQRELAERALTGWQSADRAQVLAVLSRWLRARDERVQRLALAAIEVQIAASSSESLRHYYQLLEGLPARVHRASGAELQEVVASLASHNPAEAAQFLKDELRRSNRRLVYRELIERTLDAFPEPQRSELAAVLSR